MKRVGVTGAAGFIGSHLCDRLLAEGSRSSASTTSHAARCVNLERASTTPGFRFEVLDCTRRRELRAAFDGCDAIVHLAAQKIPRYGGALKTLEANVAGVERRLRTSRSSLDADLVIASTSDVYGNAHAAVRARTTRSSSARPPRRRWAYAVSKLYDEHVALALAEERGLQRHDPAPLRLLRPAQPPELVGRPAGGLHRDAARRRDRWRSTATASRCARSRTSTTRSTASSARCARPRPAARSSTSAATEPTTILELAELGPGDARHRRSRCGRASSRTRRCRATTRTSGTGSRTRPRRASSSASRPRCASRTASRRTAAWHRRTDAAIAQRRRR